MRGVHYAGQLPEEGDDDHVLILDGIAEVIDLPVLRPEQQRVADFLGKCIGIPIVLVIAVLWMAAIWGAWAVRALVARFNRRSF
jgi:hypothetical protein